MNSNKAAFIICVNDTRKYEESRYYLDRLKLPAGFEKDIISVEGAPSMAAGYNAGMQDSDAKYKVYLHQDVFIININFISDLLRVFASKKEVGLLGMIGTRNLGTDAYAIAMWDSGKALDNYKPHPDFPPSSGVCMEVEAVDGFLMATQYDIPWREDIFDGWDFYDISQCMEFKRAGYKAAVPYQKESWCYHNNLYSKMIKYDHYRKLFIQEYGEMGNFQMREARLGSFHQEKELLRLEISKLFAEKKLLELRSVFQDQNFQGFAFLREYESIVHIDWLEEQNQSKMRICNEELSAEQIVQKLHRLICILKRMEFRAENGEEDRIFLFRNYSKYAIQYACRRYVRDRTEVSRRIGEIL